MATGGGGDGIDGGVGVVGGGGGGDSVGLSAQMLVLLIAVLAMMCGFVGCACFCAVRTWQLLGRFCPPVDARRPRYRSSQQRRRTPMPTRSYWLHSVLPVMYDYDGDGDQSSTTWSSSWSPPPSVSALDGNVVDRSLEPRAYPSTMAMTMAMTRVDEWSRYFLQDDEYRHHEHHHQEQHQDQPHERAPASEPRSHPLLTTMSPTRMTASGSESAADDGDAPRGEDKTPRPSSSSSASSSSSRQPIEAPAPSSSAYASSSIPSLRASTQQPQQPQQQEQQQPQPQPQQEERQQEQDDCIICLEPDSFQSPCDRLRCCRACVHERCFVQWWRTVLAQNAYAPLRCPVCRRMEQDMLRCHHHHHRPSAS